MALVTTSKALVTKSQLQQFHSESTEKKRKVSVLFADLYQHLTRSYPADQASGCGVVITCRSRGSSYTKAKPTHKMSQKNRRLLALGLLTFVRRVGTWNCSLHSCSLCLGHWPRLHILRIERQKVRDSSCWNITESNMVCIEKLETRYQGPSWSFISCGKPIPEFPPDSPLKRCIFDIYVECPMFGEKASSKCIASSNKCLTSSNKKLLGAKYIAV